MNHELPDVQAGFRKGRGTRYQIANIHWIIKKARVFQKNIYSALLTMPKTLTVGEALESPLDCKEIHTVKGFGIVKKAEIDVLLELLLFP